MNKIRNFYFANKEAPIFGLVTKSQLITIVSFSVIPGIWFYYNLQTGANPFLTIFSFIIFACAMGLGYVVTSIKIDGRNIFKFLTDKRREKVTIKSKRANIPSTDINKLIDSIKE